MATTQQPEAERLDRIADETRGTARGLTAMLAAVAGDVDDARRVPDEIIEELHGVGLLDIANPWAHGGTGEYDALLAATYELGRGSGSVAWGHAVWTQHNWMLGLWPEAMQAEYFATPRTLCSSAFNPAGATVVEEPGGYRLSGTWSFSSGCDGAQWLMLAGIVPGRGLCYLMVPADGVEIVDTWFVSGLKGTGSKDLRVDGAFVPDHRVVAAKTLTEPRAASPGDRPSYGLPIWPLVSLSLTYAVMGMARGAVDAFEERLRVSGAGIGGNRQADQAAVQLRLSEAAVEVDAALLLCDRAVADMLGRARRDDMPSVDQRLAYARDRAYAIRLSAQAVNRLFDASGANGLYSSSPLQRFHRDVNAGSHQPAHSWDTYGVHYGRAALGLEMLPTARLV